MPDYLYKNIIALQIKPFISAQILSHIFFFSLPIAVEVQKQALQHKSQALMF